MNVLLASILIVCYGAFCSEVAASTNANQSLGINSAPLVIACLQNGNLSLMVLSPEKQQVDEIKRQSVVLMVPTSPVTEIKSYQDGNTVFFGALIEGITWQEFGRSSYQRMVFLGKEAELNSFQQLGERWACIIDGVLYQEVRGKAVPLAKIAVRSYKQKMKKVAHALMSKRMDDENWCFEAEEGRIFEQEPTGKFWQIGWKEWRVANLGSGGKILILMTKGMGENARWSGRYAGNLYIEK